VLIGSLKTTFLLYPSHWRFDLVQLWHVGRSSPHLIRRFRHAASDDISHDFKINTLKVLNNIVLT
jgi:hypothetical protein